MHRAGIQTKRAGSGYAYYVVVVLMLAYVCSFVDRTILGLMIEPIKADMNLSDFEISLLAGFAFALFYTGLGIPFGWLADRSDRGRLVFWGVIVWSIMTAACGMMRSFGGLMATRMGVGVGEATLSPSSYSLIPDLFPREKLGTAGSIYASGLTVGGGLAMILGGAAVQAFANMGETSLPVIGQVQPWQMAFLFVGAIGIPVALLTLTIRDPRRDAGPIAIADKAGVGETFSYLWQHRGAYLPVLFGYSTMVIVSYALVIWIPTFFIRTHGMNPAEVGLTLGSMMLFGGTAGLLAGGFISDWLSRRGHVDAPIRVILFSVVSQAPFFIGATLAGDRSLSLALMAVAVFLLTLNGGLQGATFQLLTPKRMHGQMVAIYLTVANVVGLGIGPIVTGVLTDKLFGDPARIGESLALTAAFSLAIAACLLVFAIPRARQQIASHT